MKFMIALPGALLVSVLLNAQAAVPARGQAPRPPVTETVFFDHVKVADAFAKGTTLLRAPDFTVMGYHRGANGRVEVHDKETDVIYVISGAADFVTGGTMLGGAASAPGQWLGTGIAGGQTHHLVKGDMVIVPAGTPHWFKAVPTDITYYVVKVIKP